MDVGGEAMLNLPQDLMVTMVCSHVVVERPDVILNNIHRHIQDGWFAMVCHGLRGVALLLGFVMADG